MNPFQTTNEHALGCYAKSIEKKYTWHSNPGHAWLAVPLAEIRALGIGDKISGYSYRSGSMAYLEEDCDAGVFIEAKRASGAVLTAANFSESFKENTPIRGYNSFKQ